MKKIIAGLLLLTVLILGWGQREKALPTKRFPAGTVVLALGDSLTAGHNGHSVDAAQSYPVFLAERTGWNIINAGVSGDTSAQALQRWSELKAQRAELLLLSIGGNDFLRQIPESETRRNISTIIEQAQQRRMTVVLLGVPQPKAVAALGFLDDHPLYAELGKKFKIHVFSEGWGKILAEEALRGDRIHPNVEGYRRFAADFEAYLRRQKLL